MFFNPKPLYKKEREKCPFYGFTAGSRILPISALLETIKKQCALVTDSFAPCKMEENGQKPDWNTCPSSDKKMIQKIKGIRVFPVEFRPEKNGGWRGISFSEWYKYVMK